jgi:hypothetical protein
MARTRKRFRFEPRFERRGDELLPFRHYIGRLGKSFLTAMCIVIFALLIGTLGYHYVAELHWLDAELNAAMILTGMGPVDPMKTNAAKIFASAYALFSGVVFLTSMGIVLAPVFHRVVHKFHLADDDGGEKDDGKSVRSSSAKGK